MAVRTGLRNVEKKKRLRVDIDKLYEAMEDGSPEAEYYLDLQTGEILFISDYMDDDETRKLKDQIEEHYQHYERIPKAESREGYEDMVDFIATIEDKHLVDLLEVAINGKGAFRRFKDVLLNYPQVMEKWIQFKDDRIQGKALEWLNDIDVTPS